MMKKTLLRTAWDYVRIVPDFPKAGITFYDITPLLLNPKLYKGVVKALVDELGENVDAIGGIESRGFIFAAPVAYAANKSLVLFRKPGKLPCETASERYGLEYGKDELHMHVEDVRPGDHVVIVDDVLATGGTAEAACKLVERQGGVIVGCVFLLELKELKGAARLANYRVSSLFKI